MHLGNNIARLRELRHIKQAYIARQLNISQQAYSRIEKSAKVPDDVLGKIAAELGVDCEVIRYFDEKHLFSSIIGKKAITLVINITLLNLDEERMKELLAAVTQLKAVFGNVADN